jgi:WD40 repeat protein
VQPNTNNLAFSSKDGQIFLWSISDRPNKLTVLKHFDRAILCLDYSPDAKYLSCANDQGKIYIYDLETPNIDTNWIKLNVSEHESTKINSPKILQ